MSRQEGHLATSCCLLLVSNQVPQAVVLGGKGKGRGTRVPGPLMSGLRGQGNRSCSRNVVAGHCGCAGGSSYL